MKKKYLFFLIFGVFLLTAYAFQGNQISQEETQKSERELELVKKFSPFNLPFPKGTKFNITESALEFTLPEPYYLIGIGMDGNIYTSYSGGSGSVTCDCTEGSGGCNPIKMKGKYGCLMTESCSECSKSVSSIAGINNTIKKLAILNPDYQLSVDKFSEINNHYLLPPEFLDAKEISSSLRELRTMYSQSSSKSTKIVFANIYGYILPVEIPSDMDNTSISLRASAGDDDKEVCDCNSSGSCDRRSKLGVVWCDAANCTSCTMSGIASDNNGNEKHFLVTNGKITLTK